MALVNINFTVLAHAYVLYARALQSRIRGGTFAAPVRPALKSGTAMRTTVKSGTAFAVPAGPSTPPLIIGMPFGQIGQLFGMQLPYPGPTQRRCDNYASVYVLMCKSHDI